MKIITLLSGGIDSTVLMYYLKSNGAEVKALGINYGQNHLKELEYANMSSKELNIDFKIIDISNIRDILLNNSLTTDDPKLIKTGSDTVVPNRNMIFLAIAASYAFSLKYDKIAIAAHIGDHFIYPDCRPTFFHALENTLKLAYWNHIEIFSPFSEISKSQIIEEGTKLNVSFDKTRSCYTNEIRHCGKCGACIERKLAFKQIGIEDPVLYN